MTQDDIPGVMGAPGGPGGRQGAPGGARGVQDTPGAKKSDKIAKNDPKLWFRVPKVCPDTQKGWYLLICEAFGAIWVH